MLMARLAFSPPAIPPARISCAAWTLPTPSPPMGTSGSMCPMIQVLSLRAISLSTSRYSRSPPPTWERARPVAPHPQKSPAFPCPSGLDDVNGLRQVGISRTGRALLLPGAADGSRHCVIPAFELLSPVRLNIVCFTLRGANTALRDHFLEALKEDGRVLLTPTFFAGKPAMRAAFVNWWRTSRTSHLYSTLWNSAQESKV